jgi:hypothetical protein
MKTFLSQLCKGVIIVTLLWMSVTLVSSQHVTAWSIAAPFLSPQSPPSLSPTPFFRYPVVPNAQVSGYLDHNGTYPVNLNNLVTFFSNRKNASASYGYTFSCPEIGVSDWVACEGPYSSEAACPNYQELWYDGHTGTDFEYAADWHETGPNSDTCHRSRFTGITRPVYAPAAGKVQLIQLGHPSNGNAIFITHDLDGDGDYNDDIIRSAYLHFADGSIAVAQTQPIAKGQYLGLGGMTGKAYTPHLHFEVQRSTDPTFATNKWPVDPFGWVGSGNDPWPYANYPLWLYETFLSTMFKNYAVCSQGASLIQNGDFEQGSVVWTEQTSTPPIIRSTLPVTPTSGVWAAWLGGFDNANETLRQDFLVPINTGTAQIRYWVWIAGAEPGGTPYDHVYVRLRDANGAQTHFIDDIDNTWNRGVWIDRWLGLYGLDQYVGQTLRLSFEAVTDNNRPTHFVVDDVRLTMQCGSGTGPLRAVLLQSTPGLRADPPNPLNPKP